MPIAAGFQLDDAAVALSPAALLPASTSARLLAGACLGLPGPGLCLGGSHLGGPGPDLGLAQRLARTLLRLPLSVDGENLDTEQWRDLKTDLFIVHHAADEDQAGAEPCRAFAQCVSQA